MNVLVIPEDFRKDQYLLKPIIQAMLEAAGKGRAKVQVCKDPRLGGVSRALKWSAIEPILDRYEGMVQVFLLCVDRDGVAERRAKLDHLEERARARLSQRRVFLAENAWQEIEVWGLAGQDLPSNWEWAEIRGEPNAKERFFIPCVKQRRLTHEPGQGRKTIGNEAAKRYSRVRQLCPEDVANLEKRIAEALEA